ncbi:MAG: ATP-binding cassette domain-containing protein [Bacilli bacterium]|nr:ATP-binding cassette domain-containing protein [Bacilli bacterium]
MSNLKITNLKFSYDDKNFIFKDLNFTLRKDKTLSIIGIPNSGKTTLLKILTGELDYEGSVLVNGISVSKANINAVRRSIVAVYRESSFINDLVIEELRHPMENMNIAPSEINAAISEINDYFNINRILKKKIDDLSLNDRTLVKILSYALVNPSYIALDDLLIDLDTRTKILLLNYLNSKEIRLINVTSNMEDVLYTDYILCLYNGISAIDGRTLDVLDNEKILKRLGFDLPFMVDLSIQLQLYGLINKSYLNKEGMVDALWK